MIREDPFCPMLKKLLHTLLKNVYIFSVLLSIIKVINYMYICFVPIVRQVRYLYISIIYITNNWDNCIGWALFTKKNPFGHINFIVIDRIILATKKIFSPVKVRVQKATEKKVGKKVSTSFHTGVARQNDTQLCSPMLSWQYTQKGWRNRLGVGGGGGLEVKTIAPNHTLVLNW